MIIVKFPRAGPTFLLLYKRIWLSGNVESLVALAGSITGDAVSDLVETAQFLDVEMYHLARVVALISAHRWGRLQVAPTVKAMAGENPSDSGVGDSGFGGDQTVEAPLPARTAACHHFRDLTTATASYNDWRCAGR